MKYISFKVLFICCKFFTNKISNIIAGYPAVQRGYPQQQGMPSCQLIQKGQGYHGQRITPQPGSY